MAVVAYLRFLFRMTTAVSCGQKTKERIRQLQTLLPQLTSAMVLTTATEEQTRTDDSRDLILESRILSQIKWGRSEPQDSIFPNLVPLNWWVDCLSQAADKILYLSHYVKFLPFSSSFLCSHPPHPFLSFLQNLGGLIIPHTQGFCFLVPHSNHRYRFHWQWVMVPWSLGLFALRPL